MLRIRMADLIIYGGTIISMDDIYNHSDPHIEYVAIKQGKITHIGSTRSDILKHADANTRYIELQGNQTLLPGFIEPHQHAIQQALTKCLYIPCSAYVYSSYSEITSLFQKTIAEIDPKSNNWCLFFGWDPEIISDLPELNFDVLDSFSTDIPIVVVGQNGHTSWANSKAFKLAGVCDGTDDPAGGRFVRDSSGKLTGQMMEIAASRRVVPVTLPGLTADSFKDALDKQWREYASAGFTTVTDLMFIAGNELFETLLLKKAESQDCPVRLALYQKDIPCLESRKVFPENDKIWVAGIKLFADGSPHCGTAALQEEYLHNEVTRALGFPEHPNCGTTNFTKGDFLGRVRFWHDKGEHIAVHAHGERAIGMTLDALEEVCI